MVKGRRQKRLGSLIHKEIASMILKDVKDPRLDGVTITNVVVSDDYSTAKVFFFIHKDMKLKSVLKGFESAKGFLKAELSHVLQLRRVPELSFIYDDTLDMFEKLNPDKIGKDIV